MGPAEAGIARTFGPQTTATAMAIANSVKARAEAATEVQRLQVQRQIPEANER